MFDIQILNKISNVGLEKFDTDKYTISEDAQNPDGIMLRSASMHDMELPASLKAIARAGAGVNNIPVDKCSKDGIVVFNTPGANANGVKELVIAGLLLSSRKIVAAINWAQGLKGEGAEVPKLVEKGKGAFGGPEILGKKLGVIGLGAIGSLVANAGCDLGMQVYGFDPYISVDAAWGLNTTIKHATSFDQIFANCDYISVHVPLTDETRGFIGGENITKMKDGVRILNFARAELVDNDDIKAALANGKVSSYVLDFPTEDLLGIENVVTIPHLGASTPESEDNCAKMAAKELIDFLENGNIVNSVNFPTVKAPRTTDARICVLHHNVPNMLAQISSIVAETGTNIETMINKSKKDMAYTVLDIVGDVCAECEEKITAIDGVIRIRVIK